jgi:hypothetical protein
MRLLNSQFLIIAHDKQWPGGRREGREGERRVNATEGCEERMRGERLVEVEEVWMWSGEREREGEREIHRERESKRVRGTVGKGTAVYVESTSNISHLIIRP